MNNSKTKLRKDGKYLSTLARGLSVLRSFTKERPEMTLSEVAVVTELSPAVARRCLSHGHVTMVWARVVAPAQVHPKSMSRNVAHTVIERLDVHRHALSILVQAQIRVGRMPAHGQVRAIQLYRSACGGDRFVRMAHRLGYGENVLLISGVVLVGKNKIDTTPGDAALENVAKASRPFAA